MTPEPHQETATIPVVRRTPFDRWCFDTGLTDAQIGGELGCSAQMVSLMRRPFTDPARKRPGAKLLTRIVRKSDGKVRPEDFSPPVADILNGLAA